MQIWRECRQREFEHHAPGKDHGIPQLNYRASVDIVDIKFFRWLPMEVFLILQTWSLSLPTGKNLIQLQALPVSRLDTVDEDLGHRIRQVTKINQAWFNV